MAGTRIEKYQSYRDSIANSERIPTIKSPSGSFASEAGEYKKIVLRRRIINSIILLGIVVIITLLVVFGIIIF